MSDVVDGLMVGLGEEVPQAGETQPPAPSIPEAPVSPATPEPAPTEPQARPEPGPGFVPIAGLLDEREKRQALERRIAAFEAQQQPQTRPSIYDDPEAYQAAIEHRIEQTRTETRFDLSERFANQQHGAEVVEAAKAWALKQDPYTRQALAADPDPIGTIVARHRQQQLLEQIGPDQDAYVRRRAAELGLIAAAAPSPVAIPQPVQQQPAPQVPPRSLASTPAASNSRPTEGAIGLDAAFGEVFKKG